MSLEITVEMIDALDMLRHRTRELRDDKGSSKGADMAQAFDVLDSAGVFWEIDEEKDAEERAYAHTMAGLLGVDLNDRYPKGDENGIIGTAGGPGFLRGAPDA